MPSPHLRNARGSIVTYLLVTIFLLGLLTLAVSEGPRKSATTQQLDTLVMQLQNDLDMMEAAINDCVLVYPHPVDINNDGVKDGTDNPNAPFPLTYTASGTTSTYNNNGPLEKMVCPGAPPTPLTGGTAAGSKQLIFGNQAGRSFSLVGNAARYNTNFRNDNVEGVLIKIEPVTETAIWAEAAARINSRYSACKVLVQKSSPCTNTCIFYYYKRLPTGITLGTEPECPAP